MAKPRLINLVDNNFVRTSYQVSNETMNVDPIFTQSVLDTDLKDPYQFYSTDNRKMYILMNDENKTVGFAGLLPLDENRYEITRFVILPEYRRQGYGTQLLNFLTTEYSCVLSCLSTNFNAVTFYDKLMTRHKVEHKVSRNGREYDLIWYQNRN